MIYLASRSPRRAELLRQIGVEFEVVAVDVDESRLPGEAPADYVCRVARDKAEQAAAALAARGEAGPVLAADTTIALDGDIIGKPRGPDDCCRILSRLSGREHEVLSAVALARGAGIDLRLARNRVEFRRLESGEIDAYCASAEPLDKAGAYAIQGKAACFARRLEGSYSAVMGLPLFETAELLREAGIELLKS